MDMLQFHKSLGLEKQMRKIEFYYFEHNLEKKRKKEKLMKVPLIDLFTIRNCHYFSFIRSHLGNETEAKYENKSA